jgi:prepilin-type N-terminal cleavage/methylation domain-containing protein
MGRRFKITLSNGFSLIEVVLVLAVMGLCLTAAAVSLGSGLNRQGARGAAQDCQAAVAWAQIGVVWQGGSNEVGCESGSISVSHDHSLCGGDLGSVAPAVAISTNLTRWRAGEGIRISLGGDLASPDGGGSLYFHASQGAYRVVVRPESGLSVRSWAGDER